ncbi:tRNA pseudouridine(38-40) synthase TruA [bacterium]|nr:tRNA pseudouridine(38-40) synthase TruA [bacterium]
MKRYKLEIEYVGKNYAGSQIQLAKNGTVETKPTIQGELEKAISTLTGVKSSNQIRTIKTIFSGRTDAGVNARAQVVHFDTDKEFVASKFIRSINKLLPNDISVSSIEEVDKNFHSQLSAKQRHYEYRFINRNQKSAFDGNLMRIEGEINIERMSKALKYLEGEHDFRAFKNSGVDNPNTICKLTRAECRREEDFIIIELSADRFLYNMVRNIAGTLLMIEKDNLEPEMMKEILSSKDRSRAGKKISPYGLTLVKVDY